MEGLPLIDVSSEDDLLVSTSSDGVSNCQFAGLAVNGVKNDCDKVNTVSAQEGESMKAIGKLIERVPEESVSPEQKQMKYGKHNLRKSLAWDSAFFTSEGVLNTEELAIVNSTFRKTEASALTGIPEELARSTESISALDSDSWALENLEVDLFANVRASIQMSLGKCDEASNGHSRNTKDIVVTKAPRYASSKKVELSSQNKKNPSIATKRNAISRQLPEHSSKELPIAVKAPARTADSKVLKIPRIVSRPTLPTGPSKAAIASDSTQMKGNKGKFLTGNADVQQTANMNKMNGDARSTTAKSILSLKSTRASVNSVNGSSDTRGKSLSENTRKRSASRNLDLSASGPIASRTPVRTSKSRVMSKSTSNPRNGNSKVASSVSPSSSIDSLASESSSSSTLTAKKLCKLIDNLDVRSSSSSTSLTGPPDCSMKSDLRTHSLDQSSVRNEKSASPLHKECLTKEPSEIHSTSKPSGDHSKNCPIGDCAAESSKPSGLRMPTPKMGYFDAEKSIGRNPKAFSQAGQKQRLLKGSATRVGNTDVTNKLRSVRPATQNEAHKFDSPKTRSSRSISYSTNPASPMQEPKRDVDFAFGSMTDSNHYAQKSQDSQPEVFEVKAEVVDKAELRANQIPQKSTLTVFAAADGSYDLTDKNTLLPSHCERPETLEKSSFIIQEGSVDKNLHLDAVFREKENLFPAHRPDGLSEDLKTENMNLGVVDFVAEKVSSLSLTEMNGLNMSGNS